jgi:hypothetical protein
LVDNTKTVSKAVNEALSTNIRVLSTAIR